ncbi:hypothetical protein D3C80_711430 [compost metagenome]
MPPWLPAPAKSFEARFDSTTIKTREHGNDPCQATNIPDRDALDRLHSRGRAPRQPLQPVHPVARRQPADHRHCYRRLGRRAGWRCVLVADRPVHRPAVRRRGGSPACRPGAETGLAADDFQPRAVRRLWRGHPDRAGVPDVFRLQRHGRGAVGAGHCPTDRRQRQHRHPDFRGVYRRTDHVRLSGHPPGGQGHQRAGHSRLCLPVYPPADSQRHRPVAGQPPLWLEFVPVGRVPVRFLADRLRAVRGRLLALFAEQDRILEDLRRRRPRYRARRPGLDGAGCVRRGPGRYRLSRP